MSLIKISYADYFFQLAEMNCTYNSKDPTLLHSMSLCHISLRTTLKVRVSVAYSTTYLLITLADRSAPLIEANGVFIVESPRISIAVLVN